MSSADAVERARDAARARWAPSPVISRAVQTIVTRQDELNDDQRDRLRQVASEHEEASRG